VIRILGSYFYLGKYDLTALLAAQPVEIDFFADSGGFSAMTTGAVIDLRAYADWLITHRRVVNMAAGLDVVGDWRATAANTDRLCSLVGDAVTVVPTFHVRSPWHELRRLCRGHRMVALGGAVRLAGHLYEPAMLRWAANAHLIAREHGTRLHGFGLTRPVYAGKLPWFSVDSSFWNIATRTGKIRLWDETNRCMTVVDVGREARTIRNARLIAAYGGDARRVARPGFGMVTRDPTHGRADRAWLSVTGAVSDMRYERHLRATRPAVTAPPGVHGDGPKIYLVIGARGDFEPILAAAEQMTAGAVS
jgi:hypothetical protein